MAKKRKLEPILTNLLIFNPSVIEKTPNYLSVEVGGIVPSVSWLIHLFFKNMLKFQAYYDAESIKILALSEISSPYASYKVTN